jgi:ubiquitin fusion degradation protein 1
MGIDFYSNSPI